MAGKSGALHLAGGTGTIPWELIRGLHAARTITPACLKHRYTQPYPDYGMLNTDLRGDVYFRP